MSFSVTILLTTGENSGPTYNVYECVNNICNLIRSDLPITSGQPFIVTGITEGTLSLKIESIPQEIGDGNCDNSVIIPIQNLPTPTPTPTNTPTPSSSSVPIEPSPTPSSSPIPIEPSPTPSSSPIPIEPSPTPSNSPTSVVFSTFYLSSGVLDPNGHCDSPGGVGYNTGTPIYYSGTILIPDELQDQIGYSDTSLTTPFDGGTLYYFVDTQSGSNTEVFLTQFGSYKVVNILNNGSTSDIQAINCNNGGSQL